MAVAVAVFGALLSFLCTRALQTPSDISDRTSERDLRIPEGWQAMAILAQDVTPAGDPICPGGRVDILGTFNKPVSGEQVTLNLLKEVGVLALDDADPRGADNGCAATSHVSRTVTLLVTPEQAELLSFAVERGVLSMAWSQCEGTFDPDNGFPPSNRIGRDVIRWYDGGPYRAPNSSLIPLFDRN